MQLYTNCVHAEMISVVIGGPVVSCPSVCPKTLIKFICKTKEINPQWRLQNTFNNDTIILQPSTSTDLITKRNFSGSQFEVYLNGTVLQLTFIATSSIENNIKFTCWDLKTAKGNSCLLTLQGI